MNSHLVSKIFLPYLSTYLTIDPCKIHRYVSRSHILEKTTVGFNDEHDDLDDVEYDQYDDDESDMILLIEIT